MCRRNVGAKWEKELQRLKASFFKNFNEDYHQFLFKVGRYKRKSGWYLYARDYYGRWRLIASTELPYSLFELIFWIKRLYDYKRPKFIIDEEFNRACWDDVKKKSEEWEEVAKECG